MLIHSSLNKIIRIKCASLTQDLWLTDVTPPPEHMDALWEKRHLFMDSCAWNIFPGWILAINYIRCCLPDSLTFSRDDRFSALSNCKLLLSYLLYVWVERDTKCVCFSLCYAVFNSECKICHSQVENCISCEFLSRMEINWWVFSLTSINILHSESLIEWDSRLRDIQRSQTNMKDAHNNKKNN